MARNGFFGVKNSHFAFLTDEDKFTYEKPLHIPGTVEIKMERSVESATSYADNAPWLTKQQDNGGSGTMSFYDMESTPELRAFLARAVGFDIDEAGHVLESAEKDPEPFAYMCEQPGHVTGKRMCKLKCYLTKPNLDAKTLEDKPEITQLDYDFTYEKVTLPSGWTGTGYSSYEDLEDYADFFKSVLTDLTPKKPAQATVK